MKKKLLKVSIVGKTNAGKSTLINNIVGEEISIINKKINTTEDLIAGIINIKNKQIIFYDTPGLNFIKNFNTKNKKLKRNLWEGLNNSDLILYLIDVSKYNLREIQIHFKKLSELEKKTIIVFNKKDLIDSNSILPKIKELDKSLKVETYFNISAKKKIGINLIIKYLKENTYISKWLFNENELTNKNDIFASNECTRNAILSELHKEIPYNLEISNKVFKYLKNGDLKIKQEIQLNNSRYKKIILGKNGDKIKNIRIRSQKSIKKIFKRDIHLYINLINSNAKKI